jgi:hypothetical protein
VLTAPTARHELSCDVPLHGDGGGCAGLTINVRKMFMEMDQGLFDQCNRHFEHEERMASANQQLKDNQWKKIEAVANANLKKRGLPPLPVSAT